MNVRELRTSLSRKLLREKMNFTSMSGIQLPIWCLSNSWTEQREETPAKRYFRRHRGHAGFLE